ncbi:alpha/beta fold hydrolase [Yinghuangia seranimata]|uniref:alpha/beta fold hydrolase n=1 Tax=Yinghuangia seranimata TaxID=408067 RepID=UPI00248C3AB9|nr:alpha/beta hydrolase [Yinghuangia seranimata]MDI2125341.1 alpha/beta hydrolase [Yinghuangia seranimata]
MPATPRQVRFTSPEYGTRNEAGEPLAVVADRWDPEGASAGTVLLLHGGGQARGSWTRSAAALAAHGWTALALDQRGHGDSDWAADGDYTIDAFIADVRAVAAEVVREQGAPPVLVGASLGGWVALLAEGERPGTARGLALVDITHRTERQGVDRIRDFMLAHRAGFADLDEVADALHAYQPGKPRQSDPAKLARNVRRHADGRWYWHWDPAFMGSLSGTSGRGPDVTPERLADAARKVAVPTLVVRGRQSDVVSEDAVREMLALIPGSTFADVADAGHMVVGDDNDVFTGALSALLDSVAGNG